MCKQIDGGIEEVLVLNCHEHFRDVVEYCKAEAGIQQIVVEFNEFEELYKKGIVSDEVYNLYIDNDSLVEIIAQA